MSQRNDANDIQRMKNQNCSIASIRMSLTKMQAQILQDLWEHFRTKGDWPMLREIYRDHHKSKVDLALRNLGNGIVNEESIGKRWPGLKLTLLGALLTKDGPAMEALLLRFFEFEKQLFLSDPRKESSNSGEIGKAMALEANDLVLLGKLLWLGSFGGGRNDGTGDWSVASMEEAAVFAEEPDLRQVFQKWATRLYSQGGGTSRRQRQLFLPPSAMGWTQETSPTTEQSHPGEITVSLARLRKKYPDFTKLGFLIMRFGKGTPYGRIVRVIKTTAEKHGLIVIKADDEEFHNHLWHNIQTLLHGCGFGIALYERIERDEPNANVGLEVGYLMAMKKPVMILKDQTVKALPTDLTGQLYKDFDPHHPEKTIPEQMTKWLRDNGVIV